MKAAIVPLVLSVFLFPFPAAAEPTEGCGNSYVILPDGFCHNLSYLSILGDNRANMQQVEAMYQEQYDANLELEYLYTRYPDVVSETEEERDARYQSLVETRIFRDDMAAGAQSVENALYPLHLRSMFLMREAFR